MIAQIFQIKIHAISQFDIIIELLDKNFDCFNFTPWVYRITIAH